MGSTPTIGLIMKLFWKILIILAIFISALILSVPRKQNLKYGVTFSQKFSTELVGDDWRKNYLAILDDLKIKNLRLVAYWDILEPNENKFNFEDLDWQISEAEKRGAKIILAMGLKVPRWPECHIPEWVKGEGIAGRLIKYEEILINRYKNNKNIWAWQVENEPYFPFGDCKIVPPAILNSEIKQVKSLDARPIILTDAGEIGFAWPYLAVKSDIFGTTLYRYVSNRFLGNIRYSLIPAAYFRLKAGWAKLWGKEMIISELQAEPWNNGAMNPEIFNEIINYAERSGFPKAYLWGAEWWYFMREKQNKHEMWEAVKKII
ncbi:MAG: hypothetical protein US45_C0062G0003 [Candidatus Nomurabacteria bacterium GW2011_GWA1_37_20]|uniref:Glycoside hydrolase family 42 N-terminal domain-containing protein n=1 Tax=Candidatus Nomurabacteria bacterium GW2011_GWA1_37_20 TaxID=1618729 RepID=A0A0G0GSN8_9BACT|nr:MAG: hypothetical protein US45_C0062G0003 [Candidatus Nomurabacteria bacterium GW2011_GWA1_37_20]